MSLKCANSVAELISPAALMPSVTFQTKTATLLAQEKPEVSVHELRNGPKRKKKNGDRPVALDVVLM